MSARQHKRNQVREALRVRRVMRRRPHIERHVREATARLRARLRAHAFQWFLGDVHDVPGLVREVYTDPQIKAVLDVAWSQTLVVDVGELTL